jgi:uncharacterized protein YegP (UPF0339 family)
MTFEVFRNRKKEWRWRLRAANGRIVANSGESYRRRIDCMDGINLVRGTSQQTPIQDAARS